MDNLDRIGYMYNGSVNSCMFVIIIELLVLHFRNGDNFQPPCFID